MNAGRRGLLGGMAALGIGPRMARSESAGLVPQPAVAAAQVRAIGGVVGEAGCASAPRDPRFDTFRDLLDAQYRRRRRLEERLALTGGVPPGILACKSWRPWFAAAAVDRWRDEHMPDMNMVERLVRTQVFGEGA